MQKEGHPKRKFLVWLQHSSPESSSEAVGVSLGSTYPELLCVDSFHWLSLPRQRRFLYPTRPERRISRRPLRSCSQKEFCGRTQKIFGHAIFFTVQAGTRVSRRSLLHFSRKITGGAIPNLTFATPTANIGK